MPSQARSHLGLVIASNVDAAIREKGLTNRQVAESIGTTEHQVWRWRRGKVRPNDTNLGALATVLTDGDLAGLLIEEAA